MVTFCVVPVFVAAVVKVVFGTFSVVLVVALVIAFVVFEVGITPVVAAVVSGGFVCGCCVVVLTWGGCVYPKRSRWF